MNASILSIAQSLSSRRRPRRKRRALPTGARLRDDPIAKKSALRVLGPSLPRRGPVMLGAELLGALLHELADPATSAVFAIERLRKDLRRLPRTMSAVGALRAGVLNDASFMPPLKRRTVSRALESLERADLVSHVDIPPDLAVLAVPGTLELVLRNLLVNAQRHACGSTVVASARPIGLGETPWPTTARVMCPGAVVLVTIADSGPGVPESLRRSLFQPIENQTEVGGYGLGLWISRTLVRAHGGDLWLTDSLNGAAVASAWPAAKTDHEGRPLDAKAFGLAVGRARESAGRARVQLSQLSGIPDSTIRNVECARHHCTGRIRAQLLKALDNLAALRPPSTS